MTGSDPNNRPRPSENHQTPPLKPDEDAAKVETPAEESDAGGDPTSENYRRRILIGSQRDPAAYRPKRPRDWIPIIEPQARQEDPSQEKPSQEEPPEEKPSQEKPSQEEPPEEKPSQEKPSQGKPSQGKPSQGKPSQGKPSQGKPSQEEPPEEKAAERETPARSETPAESQTGAEVETAAEVDVPAEPLPPRSLPPPSVRDGLPPDLQQEIDDALGDASLDDLLGGGDSLTGSGVLEEQSQHTGRVVAVQRDDVFVELGGHQQGCVSSRQFDQPPEPGTTIEVIVQRFNPEDGLYDLTIPQAVVEVDDWADLHEGMLVDAVVTGHNSGGLECEVSRIRGFIPISQVSLYRVEDPAQFVGEKFTCLISEANPQRRNLVLSRRAVLEREKEEARQQLLDSLQPGQVHEGVVRKLVDFGAFVDIGGIDGLLHVSQVAWGRVNHPSDVLAEGQKIKVKIEKVDRATGKISLAYRDMLENPWDSVVAKYPANSVVRGTVTKLMEFGAFVELEPGVEGLVHISQLSHRHVWRPRDVVKPGEQVEVLVLSVDPESQRISLSMKELSEPEPAKKDEDSDVGELPPTPPKRKKPDKPLRGGLERSRGGDKFGLKW